MSFPEKMNIPDSDPLGLLSAEIKEERRRARQSGMPLVVALLGLLLAVPLLVAGSIFRAAVNRFDRWMLYSWLRKHSSK